MISFSNLPNIANYTIILFLIPLLQQIFIHLKLSENLSIKDKLLLPFLILIYNGLFLIASIIAIIELFTKPHYWNKTDHNGK